MYLTQGVLFGFLFGIPASLSASLSIQRSSAYGTAAGLVSGLGGAFGSALYGGIALAVAEAAAVWLTPHPPAALAITVLALVLVGGWRFVHSFDSPGEDDEQGARGWLFLSAAVVSLSYPTTFLLYLLGGITLSALPWEGAASWFQMLAGILMGAFLWQALLTFLSSHPSGHYAPSPHQIQRGLAVAFYLAAGVVLILAMGGHVFS